MKFAADKPITITLGGDIRFIWPHVFEKKQNDDGEDRYQVMCQIPYENKEAIWLLEDAIAEAKQRGLDGSAGPKATFKKGVRDTQLKMPLKDGADVEPNEEFGDNIFEGYMHFDAKTTRRPQVLDSNFQAILDPEEFYSGCIGAVSVTVAPFHVVGKAQGVTIYLNHIMVLEQGDRVATGGGASVTAEEAFAGYGTPSGDARGTDSRRESRTRSRSRDDAPPARTRGREQRGGGRDRRDSDEPSLD